MRKEVREKVIQKTVYVSDDGKTFESEQQCLRYEWRQTATKVYMVQQMGQRTSSEIYSSEALAEKAIDNRTDYSILPVYLDERFSKL